MHSQYNGPIKVLAVFEKGTPPVPCKYKITWVDRRATSFVDYHCESYYDSIVRRYKLRYWKDSFRWELIAK